MYAYLLLLDTEEEKDKFSQIYEKYRDLMKLIAFEILKNDFDAEDVVHITFLYILKKLNTIEDINSDKTKQFIIISTKYRAFNLYKERKRVELVDEIKLNPDSFSNFKTDSIVTNALSKLNPRYYDALIMKYYYGYSAKEISTMMDVTVDNVNKIISRARFKLEELIKAETENVKSCYW